MFRLLIAAALLIPLPAKAFELGTYQCAVEVRTETRVFPDGQVKTRQIQGQPSVFTVKLAPARAGKTCSQNWHMKQAPYECSASFSASFSPELVPGTPVLYSPVKKKPDIYFAPNGYIHFANDILFHASWSEFDRATLIRGQCNRQSITNN